MVDRRGGGEAWERKKDRPVWVAVYATDFVTRRAELPKQSESRCHLRVIRYPN
jgi:hypothetical protein